MENQNDIQNDGSHLVLRTVYIQKNVDDKLKTLAFQLKRSKNDIIRYGIDLALNEIEATAVASG